MPIQGTPVDSSSSDVVSASDLRAFLRDYSGMNPLLDDVEFSDTECQTAASLAVDHANVIGRPTGWSVTGFPNKYVLLLGAASHLLKSEALRQLRNQATYQDGNIQPIGIDDKQALYATLGGSLRNEFAQLVTSIKISDNMSSLGTLRSPLIQTYSW